MSRRGKLARRLAELQVSDAREIAKAGDIVKVRVLEVDLPRKRIALTMKVDAGPAAKGERLDTFRPPMRGQRPAGRSAATQAQGGSAMAAAFARLRSGG